MDTKALEKFCPWARIELIDAVRVRCARYGLDDAGRAAAPADSDVVGGTVLSSEEKSRRAALYEQIERMGYDAFCERAAYSWFNRFAAIRYMELKGYLSHSVRILSSADGDFDPECLRVAGELDLPGLERVEALELMAAGSYDELFRRIIVAQCNEFATCLPRVFDHVDAADALTLPDNLLGHGEHDVLFHLVTDIPEDCWKDKEAIGWMYQFYNAELKQAFLDSKRKAAIEDIAPATQVFTPDWIVHYMVENTLGRLWMLNNPNSALRNKMPYYIDSDGQNESFTHISGPEGITFCDPACGSGHILVYAFDLLAEMYRERGYREREIPTLILTKNLSGIEIDERAAQIATFALAMCACDHDKRFLSRGIVADIEVLESIELDTDSLPRPLTTRSRLVESLAHLSEIGSLFNPDETDLRALDAAVSALSQSSLFEAAQANRLATAKRYSKALSRSFDVVVANPPYMGSSRFNSFMSKWIKNNYPDEKSDLCYAFINRICGMKRRDGDAGIAATNSWMFLSSSEASRLKVLSSNDISSLVQLSVHGYKGIAAQVFAFTLIDKQDSGYRGGYVRLSDFDHHSLQEPKTLEAIANPDCGWFYRADASAFHDIPGSPIAYWASNGLLSAFKNGYSIDQECDYTGSPNITGDNERFLRFHWECPQSHLGRPNKWIPYSKGGNFRKWYGNLYHVVDWTPSARDFYFDNKTSTLLPEKYWYEGGITYTMLTSGMPCFRLMPPNGSFDKSGPVICKLESNLNKWMGFLNSNIAALMIGMINPTMNLQVRDVKSLPMVNPADSMSQIDTLVDSSINISRTDWNTQETSWDFKRNPLI